MRLPLWSVEARIEARDAAHWYFEQNPFLAERFETAIRAALAAVVEAPTRWPLCRDRLHRRLVVEKFPYILCYRVRSDGQVLVAALRHHSRAPDRRFTP